MDLYGILAACDARQAGVDPFLPNEFDPYHRPHHYSEWWLELSRLGLTRADTLWLGFALLAVMLVTTVAMVRPGTPREGLTLFFLLVSPAFLLAVNRTNNDLVVFVLISLGLVCFRRETWPGRALGIILFAGSAVLKYTPLVTLVVLLDLRPRRSFFAGLGLYGLVLLLGWPGLATPMGHLAQFMPVPEWIYAFGAPLFLRNYGVNVAWGWQLPAVLLAAWAFWSACAKRVEPATGGSPPERAAEREFMCGAASVVGLFFMGSSYVYKLVFAVWLLPWLWRHDAGVAVESRWGRATLYLLLAVTWLEGGIAVVLNLLIGRWSQPVAHSLLKGTLAVSQLLTWALIACFLRFLLNYMVRRGRALWVNG